MAKQSNIGPTQEELNIAKSLVAVLTDHLQLANLIKEAKVKTLDDENSIRDSLLDSLKALEHQVSLRDSIKKHTNTVYSISRKINEEGYKELGTRKAYVQIQKDISQTQKSINALEVSKNLLSKQSTKIQEDIGGHLDEQILKHKENLKQLELIKDETKSIRNNFGVAGFQFMGELTSKLGGKASQLSAPFEAAAEAAREAAVEATNYNQTLDMFTNKKEGYGFSPKDLKTIIKYKDIVTDLNKGKKTTKQLTEQQRKELQKIGLLDPKGRQTKKLQQAQDVVSLGGGRKQSPMMKGMLAGVSQLMTRLIPVVSIAAVLATTLKKIWDIMIGKSKELAEFQRNMNLSYGAAKDLQDSLYSITDNLKAQASITGRLAATRAEYLTTMKGINEELGLQLNLVTGFGEEIGNNVGELAKFQSQMGLSNTLTKNLFVESNKVGGNFQEYYNTLLGTVQLQSVQSGLQVDLKKTLEESSQISGELRANFRGNFEELAKSVFQAKLLGMNLNQVHSIGKSLLNFESSIQAEMEAELMLGRQLNLEQARYYALVGDTQGLMEEINKQNINYHEFSKMNAFQRQAIARALGMESDEMGDMLKKQEDLDKLAKSSAPIRAKMESKIQSILADENKKLEIQNKLKEKGVAINWKTYNLANMTAKELYHLGKELTLSREEMINLLGTEATLNQEAQDASARWARIMSTLSEKLEALISSGTLDAFVEGLERLTNTLLFKGSRDKMEAKKATQEFLKQEEDERIKQGKDPLTQEEKQDLVDKASEDLQKRERINRVLNRGLWSMGLGSLTTILPNTGINQRKGRLEAYKEEFQMEPTEVKDFILRPGQPPIKFHKDDLLIGGTGLDKKSNITNQTQITNAQNNEKIERLLERLLQAVEKGGDVYMDSHKVGKALVLANSRMG